MLCGMLFSAAISRVVLEKRNNRRPSTSREKVTRGSCKCILTFTLKTEKAAPNPFFRANMTRGGREFKKGWRVFLQGTIDEDDFNLRAGRPPTVAVKSYEVLGRKEAKQEL